tara:strand:+ start:1663 stop:1866 length:204 start_codon:yes stop_codon:yes gene_type:complete
MRNPEDKYSYHFTIEYEDGQEMQASYDARYKNADERSHAIGEAQHQHADAWRVVLDGVSDNYPKKTE